jgi:hypothetical protein
MSWSVIALVRARRRTGLRKPVFGEDHGGGVGEVPGARRPIRDLSAEVLRAVPSRGHFERIHGAVWAVGKWIEKVREGDPPSVRLSDKLPEGLFRRDRARGASLNNETAALADAPWPRTSNAVSYPLELRPPNSRRPQDRLDPRWRGTSLRAFD